MVPTITTLLKLAEALDRPVAYFLYAVDGQAYRLEAGDCLHLRTDLPHHWENPGTEPAEALWVRPRR